MPLWLAVVFFVICFVLGSLFGLIVATDTGESYVRQKMQRQLIDEGGCKWMPASSGDPVLVWPSGKMVRYDGK